MIPDQQLAAMTAKEVTTSRQVHPPKQKCGGIASSPASTTDAPRLAPPMINASVSLSRPNFPLPDVDPYICSPSSSHDLQHMVTSVKQKDSCDYHHDDDEELFVLMAPFEKEENPNHGSIGSSRTMLHPRAIRRPVIPRAPLRMRLQKNRDEDHISAPPLKARAMYLGATPDAPKAPLLDDFPPEVIDTVPIKLKKKRVQAEANILEDQTASTLKRNPLMLNFDDLCNKGETFSSSRMFSLTPKEQASAPDFFLVPPSQSCGFDKLFSTPRTPNNGILCFNS